VAHSIRLVTLSLFAALVLVLLLSGCTSNGPVWVDSGATYTADSVVDVFAEIQGGRAEGKPVSDAADLRHDALVGLRRRGSAAAQAADLITRTFPATAGVPLHIERARFEEQAEALVIVELIGPDGGTLSDMRLWVVGPGGDILFSSVR